MSIDAQELGATEGEPAAVAVHDLTIHPREERSRAHLRPRDLVGDITPLQELTPEVLAKPVHLFDIEPRARRLRRDRQLQLYGDKYIEVPNEPEALSVNYYLRADARDRRASP